MLEASLRRVCRPPEAPLPRQLRGSSGTSLNPFTAASVLSGAADMAEMLLLDHR